MDMNLEYYKIFYYVAKCRGITTAAEKLCITQPAVSQAIKQMENSLEAKLFIRTPRGVMLTPEGEMLYSYVSQGYEYILLGESKLKEMIGLERGKIQIGASDMTLQFYLLPFLEKFHAEYPKIKVTVTNGPTPETLDYLQQGKIDFGIVSGPFAERSDIVVEKVKKIQDVFIVGEQYQYLLERRLGYQELEKLPIICLEKDTSTRKYLDDFLRDKGVVLTPEFELATSDMIVQFVLRNLGIGCVVKEFAEKYAGSGKLFYLNFKEEIPQRDLCVVTRRKNPVSTAAETLLNIMKSYE